MGAQALQQEDVKTPGRAAAAPERFLVLDGLRGIAAFAVILDHVPSGQLGALVPNRTLSVDFFFILSGFVLAHAYGAKLEGGWSPWAFMRMRLIRLYPLYILGTMIGVLALLGRQWPGWTHFLYALIPAILFLPAPPNSAISGGSLYPYNGPAWSLFFELIANLVFAMIVRFLNWRVFAVILPVGAALTIITIFNHPDARGPGWMWTHLDAGLARVVFDFFAGVAIYRLRSVIALPAIPWWAAAVTFLVAIAVPVAAEWAPAYDAFATIVLMPLLVALASGAKVNGVVARICGVLGLLSYGVYILHVPILQLLSPGLLAIGIPPWGNALGAILIALAAGAAAAILHSLYDQPVRRWLARVLPGGAKRPEVAHSAG